MTKKRLTGSRTWSPGLHTWGRSLPGLLILGLLSAIVLKIFIHRRKMNIANETANIIYPLLLGAGFDSNQAKYILAQSAHETANFTSSIFKSNNNLFGMKHAGQRLSLGEKNGYADYKDIQTSVLDYAVYYAKHKYLRLYLSIDTFVQALKNHGYFEALTAEYLKGVRHFYNLYFGG